MTEIIWSKRHLIFVRRRGTTRGRRSERQRRSESSTRYAHDKTGKSFELRGRFPISTKGRDDNRKGSLEEVSRFPTKRARKRIQTNKKMKKACATFTPLLPIGGEGANLQRSEG